MVNGSNSLQFYVDEARIEQLSNEWLSDDPEMRDHAILVNRCFQAFHELLQSYPHETEDELVVLRLGVRLFNDGGAALKSARCGYWQPAFAMLRDMMETTWLLEYFRLDPAKINRWRTSDYKIRKKEFKGPEIRDAIARGMPSTRHEVYSRFSEHAAHPSPEGFALISPNNMTELGPFPEETRLRAFMQEIAPLFLSAALAFNAHLPARTRDLSIAKVRLMRAAEMWARGYWPHLHKEMEEMLEELEPLVPKEGPFRDAYNGT